MKNNYSNISAFITILILLVSCCGIYENGGEMAKDASLKINQISVDELKGKMENDDIFTLIDVREPGEFESGYINEDFNYNMYLEPVNIPRGLLEVKISDSVFWEDYFEDVPVKDTTLIVIYSQAGDRGALATETLTAIGYKNVFNLNGGYDAFYPNKDPNKQKKQESGGCGG